MTEQKWLRSVHPTPMLDFLKAKVSDRKLRLFACSCCRRVWFRCDKIIPLEEVEISERFADGAVDRSEMQAVLSKLGAMGGNPAVWAANCARLAVLDEDAEKAANQAVKSALHFAYNLAYEQALLRSAFTDNQEKAAQVGYAEGNELVFLLRDIFFNPFQPVPTIDPSWLQWNGGTVSKLAQVIYDNRLFTDMPILADALEEAGCADDQLLSHCRQSGQHVRGCWLLDLLLGKA